MRRPDLGMRHPQRGVERAGSLLESHTVGYEDAAGRYLNGNRTSDTFTLLGPDASAPCDGPACVARYVYDPRERLVQEQDGHDAQTSFTLDPDGGVVREVVTGSQAATTDFTFVGQQLRTAIEDTDLTRYFYDGEGNLDCATTTAGSQSSCAVPEGGSASPSLLSDYAYDYLNRLTSVRGFENGIEVDESIYTHDALDRPVEQEERHGAGGSPKTTLFSYVGLSTMVGTERHENAGGSLLTTKSYAYDPFGRRLAMTSAPAGQAAETLTYGHDTHGSVSLLLAPNGQARAAYGYRAYGGADTALTRGDTSSIDPFNPYRYTGKRQDSGSGTIDMGARRFLPDFGRFLQMDVFHGAWDNQWLGADPINQNRYALASGNPTNYHETDGHVMQYDGGSGDPEPIKQALLIRDGFLGLGCGEGRGDKFVCAAAVEGVKQQVAVYHDRDLLCEQTQNRQYCGGAGLKEALVIADYLSNLTGVGGLAKLGIKFSAKAIVKAVTKSGSATGARTGAAVSQSVFRRRLTEVAGPRPSPAYDAHHVFPRAFDDQFRAKGIDISEGRFGAWRRTRRIEDCRQRIMLSGQRLISRHTQEARLFSSDGI